MGEIMPIVRTGFKLLMTLGALVACDDASSNATFREEILANGVTHAINTDTGTWPASARWSARVALSLGRTEGDGPDVFGAISAVEMDDAGRIYVLDGQAQEVRVFGPDGMHLTTIGRPGAGPCEFRGASGLNIDPEGNVWVWETGNARFSAFTPDGRYVRSVTRRVGGVVFPWRGEILTESGDLIDWSVDFPDAQSSLTMGRLTVYTPIRTDLDSGSLDTLPPLRYEAATDYEFRLPFRNSLTFVVSSSGDIWFANTGEYRIVRVTLAGDTTLVVSRTGVEPMAVTRSERDSILARPDPIGDMTGERLNPDWIPAHKPVLARMTTDGAGHLFVFPRLSNQEAGTVVDVFLAETGEFLGQVDLPVRLEMSPPPVAAPGALLGVTKGEFDIPLVARIELGPFAAPG